MLSFFQLAALGLVRQEKAGDGGQESHRAINRNGQVGRDSEQDLGHERSQDGADARHRATRAQAHGPHHRRVVLGRVDVGRLESARYEASGNEEENDENSPRHADVHQEDKDRKDDKLDGHRFLAPDHFDDEHGDDETGKLGQSGVEQIDVVVESETAEVAKGLDVLLAGLGRLARVADLEHFGREQHDAVVGEGVGEPDEPEDESCFAVLFGEQICYLASLLFALDRVEFAFWQRDTIVFGYSLLGLHGQVGLTRGHVKASRLGEPSAKESENQQGQ